MSLILSLILAAFILAACCTFMGIAAVSVIAFEAVEKTGAIGKR